MEEKTTSKRQKQQFRQEKEMGLPSKLRKGEQPSPQRGISSGRAVRQGRISIKKEQENSESEHLSFVDVEFNFENFAQSKNNSIFMKKEEIYHQKNSSNQHSKLQIQQQKKSSQNNSNKDSDSFSRNQQSKERSKDLKRPSKPLKIAQKLPNIKSSIPLAKKKSVVMTRGVDFVPVDNYYPLKEKAKVVEHQKAFYTATLTQSDLANDDNKFFIIQALQVGEPPGDEHILFTRWGRVGVPGQIKFSESHLTRKEVIRQYSSKIQEKLARGGYKPIDVTYEYGSLNVEEEEINTYFGESNLSWRVQELVKVIFDRKMIHYNIKQIGYDEKRSPLGLIAKKSIELGYIALGKIMRLLKNQIEIESETHKRKLFNEYSSQFYSAIPHDFGYMKMQAFVLNTEQKVKEKLEMLSSLSQIQIYSELMKQKSQHPDMCDIDVKYLKLKCDIKPLECQETYRWITKYVENTHASTHDKYSIEIMGVFDIRREEEIERYRKDLGSKMMLWHGSRLSNYVGILSEGLKIAPFEAPTTGYMFGKGIYFADIVSKSANYCKPKDKNEGLLLICQVALGEMTNRLIADFNAHNLPQDCHSTRGVGKFAPNTGESLGEVFVPNGRISPTGIEGASLLYNEYVVYNRDQVICRYIVHVKFHFK